LAGAKLYAGPWRIIGVWACTTEPDPRGFSFEEARLPEDLLLEAFNALTATGTARKLGITQREPVRKDMDADQIISAMAKQRIAVMRRMAYARNSVLFTALAVEAGVNLYIAATLPDDVQALDDLKTVNRLLVAPKLTTGKPLFEEGREPTGQLRRLFKLRNRIVHPKVGKLAVAGQQGIADFTPHEAAKCLLAAAMALKTLNEAHPDVDTNAPSAPKELLEQKAWLDRGGVP
jgi:hypothetical protein